MERGETIHTRVTGRIGTPRGVAIRLEDPHYMTIEFENSGGIDDVGYTAGVSLVE